MKISDKSRKMRVHVGLMYKGVVFGSFLMKKKCLSWLKSQNFLFNPFLFFRSAFSV